MNETAKHDNLALEAKTRFGDQLTEIDPSGKPRWRSERSVGSTAGWGRGEDFLVVGNRAGRLILFPFEFENE